MGRITPNQGLVVRIACEPDIAEIEDMVKDFVKLGVRLGNWLSPKDARALWQSADKETLKGKRDRAIIAVLLGCGLAGYRPFDREGTFPEAEF